MKKKKVNNNSSNLDVSNGEVPRQQKRHVVSWSQEEDDILREQIRLHGTENWAIIASKFKDKTTRQCRRRWFTYLSSDFKKGGWSPEEDMLLCEAQKVYGNKWTEIAKVVSGRTDNAVKNRFTTLCKKRAKREGLAKENSTACYTNLNNGRVISRNGLDTDGGFAKKIRTHKSSIPNCIQGESIVRHPFAVISQSGRCFEVNFSPRMHVDEIKKESNDGSIDNNTKIKRDDLKVVALMQQAELPSYLAFKANTETTDRSLEIVERYMVLQGFLEQNKESQQPTIRKLDTDSDVYSSPSTSDHSTESALLSTAPHDKREDCEPEICVLQEERCVAEKKGKCHVASTNEVESVLRCNDMKPDNRGVCGFTEREFSSPVHVTPLFRALAAAIPSPKFSESEKHFLMKTLGMELTSPNTAGNSSQPLPACKRSLFHCL